MNARSDAAELAIQTALNDCVVAGAPGAIIAIDTVRGGFSFSGASGLFARDQERPLQPDDPFRAASVTKAVTAVTVLRLAETGHWKLDDPVVSFFPPAIVRVLSKFEGLSDRNALTIRSLLNHTSGLPDYFFDDKFQAGVRADSNRLWRPEELIEAAAEVGRLNFAPGTDFSYGDTGYVLAGLAIEHVVGCQLADAYRSLVFNKLEMDATYLEWHEPSCGPALSHHYDGDNDMVRTNTSFDWAGGGLVTTAADLIRFLRGVFNMQLIDSHSYAELTRWRDGLRWRPNSSARYLRYGLGMGVNLASEEEIIGATGVWGAFAYFCPALDAAIAGTVNSRGLDRAPLLDSVVAALKSLL